MNNLKLIIQPITENKLVVFKLLSFLVMVFMFGVNGVRAQTNPGSVFDLSTGSWTLTGWSSSATSSRYPTNGATGSDNTTGVSSSATTSNMRFWLHGTGDPAIGTAASNNYTGSYSGGNGTIYGNGTNGIGFNNTGAAGVGSAVLSVNTTNRQNIQVSWTGRTIATGARTYGIRLMYRVGTSGSFVDANGTASNIFYAAAGSVGSTTMSTITLPSDANNAGTVQLMWFCYNAAGTTSGTRPTLGLDEITVSSSSTSSAPLLAITGTTAHGSACVGSSTSAIQYTITNSGTNAATGVSVGSSNSTEFAISTALSSTTIAGNGGTATYSVTFTPSATGARTSTVTVSSVTSGSNSPTSSLTGTGSAPVAAVVTSSAASSLGATTATLNGNVTTLGACPNTIEKGFVYALTSDNADPLNGGTGVTKTSVAGLTTGAYILNLIGLSQGAGYSYKAYVYDGSTYTYGNVLTFTTITPPANDDCSSASTIIVNATSTGGNNALATKSNPTTLTDAAYTTGTAKDMWYTFTPTCSGNHTITLIPSSFDGAVALFTGGACPNPTFTSVADDGASNVTETITFNATANTTYKILVWGYNSASGSFTIGVTTPTLAVTTNAASSITTTGASLNGGVTTLCPNITEIGFVYSLTSANNNPLINGTGVNKVSVTSVEGAFSTSLSGLTTGSAYSYKAYAFDGTSYTYGSVQTFTPNTAPVILATYTFTGTACSASALTASGVGANYTVANASVTGQTCNNNSGTSYSVGSSSWGTTFNSGRYIQVSITPDANYLLTLTNLSFSHLRSAAGATTINVRSSLDGYASDLTSNITVTTGSNNASIDLSGFTNQSSTIIFRIYGWGGNSTGDLRLDNIAFSGNINAAVSMVLSNTNLAQFTIQNLSRNNINVPVSRFQAVVSNGTATLNSLSFSTPNNGTTNNYIGGTDIDNFKLWYDTDNDFIGSTQLGSNQISVNNNPSAGETVSFTSLAQSLAAGTYYFWITADVLSSATSGRTLTVNAPTLTLASGSNTGSIAATGTQTIIGVPINYYLNGTNSVSAATSYWTGANGTGSQLTSLSISDLYLNIGSNVSTSGDFTLSNGSKFIVNNGGNLTIASGNIISGTIDVENGGTLTLNSTSIPTLGTLGSTSTIIFGANGAQAVTTKNYGNLTLSGGNTKTISGAAAVSGALTINGTVLALGSNNLTPTTLTLDGLGTKNDSWGSTAGSANYKNVSYFGATGTGTVTPSSNTAATASFSNIATSQSINYGTATVSLSGKVASGSIYPTNGETVSVTINGVAQTTTTTSGDGSFSINYTTSTLPVSASPYTITYAYTGSANGFLKAASNETSTALTVNAATNNWVGGTGNWSSTSNWSLSRLPSALNDNIVINSGTPTMDADYIVGAGRTLTISGTGSLVINAGKSITIDGTADFGGKSVTLKSTAVASGSIGKITGTLTGATNVTVERFITGQSIRGRWRFLSSPVQGQTVANWMNSFYVTGPGDSIAANAVNGSTLGTTNTNGFNTNYANILYPSSTMSSDVRSVKTTSIRVYDETVTTGGIDGGWGNITTATTLDAGKGFRAYIRGDKNAVNSAQTQLGTSANGNIQGSVNITLTGTPNQGEVNANPTFTSSGTLANDGWNLLGNPYPCSYDFVAHRNAGSSVFSNIDPTVYVYSGVTGGYVSFNALSNTNLNLDNGIIPAGAGFFVKANAANPVFKFQEAYKTTNNHVGTGVHKTAKTDEFGIKYYKDSTESDYIVVKPYQGATMNAENLDIIKVQNDNLNLSAYGADSILLSASLIPPVIEETRVKLNVEATAIGTYNFDFKNMDNFQSDITVHLFDRYTNKTIDVRKNTKYTFSMGPGTNQWGKNRFELILNMDKTGINEFNVLNKTQMLVYPNPATDVLNIDISNSSFKNSEIVVYNISGTEVIKTNMASNSVQLNIETLSAGVYFVKVSNQNGFNKTVKFVK